MLAADVKRSNLLKEEKELFMEFEQQEEIENSGLNPPVKSGTGSETVDRASWSEEEWMRRLERVREVGVELEASGADAAESKVLLLYYYYCCYYYAHIYTYIYTLHPMCLRCIYSFNI